MEAFSTLGACCAGNSPVTDEFPTQMPQTRSFDVSLICTWTETLANNADAGDLRRYRAHYDVIVMWILTFCTICLCVSYVSNNMEECSDDNTNPFYSVVANIFIELPISYHITARELPVSSLWVTDISCNLNVASLGNSRSMLLSGVPDYFDRNKILSGYDLSHYQVPHCIKSFLLFCLICVYSSQFSILFQIMYLL